MKILLDRISAHVFLDIKVMGLFVRMSMSVKAKTSVIPTLDAEIPTVVTHANALLAMLVMDIPVLILTSVLLALTTVPPMLNAKTLKDHLNVNALKDSPVTESLARMSMNVKTKTFVTRTPSVLI